MLSLSVSLLWLFAMLSAAAHFQDAGRGFAGALGGALTFAIVYPLAIALSPQPNWIGVLIGLAAWWRLITGRLPRMGGVLAGSCAALAAALQTAGGASPWMTVTVAAVALLAAFIYAGAGRSAVARQTMLMVCALGAPIVGLAGDMLYGWQSATMLNRGIAVAAPSPPVWAIIIVGLAIVAGLVRGYWIRR